MMKTAPWLLAFLVLPCLPCALAATIRIVPDAYVDLSTPPGVLRVKLANNGDTAARFVRAEARLGKWRASASPVAVVAPNGTCRADLPLTDLPSVPGLYHIVLKTHYSDDSGHPFSAIAMVPLQTREMEIPEPVVGALAPLSMGTNGRLTLEVWPLDEATTNVEAQLILPDEMFCPDPVRRLTMAQGLPASTEFTVRNLSAQNGSTYSVFAKLDCEENGVHRSAVAAGTIAISLNPIAAPTMYTLWLGVAVLLLLAFVVAQFTARRKG
jgi:hypothetical protein